MLTCLSRSVSVRSHGRLASLKHPVLSPPPLWNTPNKTPPKSSTNSYSNAAPSFSFHSSASSRNPFKYHPFSLFFSVSLSSGLSFDLWGAVPYLLLSLPHVPRPRPLCILNASLTTLLITELIFLTTSISFFVIKPVILIITSNCLYRLLLFSSFSTLKRISGRISRNKFIKQDHAIQLWKSTCVGCPFVIKEAIYISPDLDTLLHLLWRLFSNRGIDGSSSKWR